VHLAFDFIVHCFIYSCRSTIGGQANCALLYLLCKSNLRRLAGCPGWIPAWRGMLGCRIAHIMRSWWSGGTRQAARAALKFVQYPKGPFGQMMSPVMSLISPCRPCRMAFGQTATSLLMSLLIVGLDVALKGPFPLVGESELARESEIACFGVFHLLEIYIRK
jgi:hypothetical protein